MPYPKPKNKADIIGKLGSNILEFVSDYQESRHQEVKFRNPVDWSNVSGSIEEMYLRNRAERDALLKRQAECREHSKQQEVINAERQRKLHELQVGLHARFVNTNSFIKECLDKRKSAERLIGEKVAQHAQLRAAIDEHIKEVADLKAFRDQIRITMLEYSQYDEFLAKVVKDSPIFESTQDCVSRCDALLLAQVHISNQLQRLVDEAEEMRRFLIQSIKNVKLQVMGLKTEIIEIERAYLEARNDVQRWEHILESAELVVAENDVNKERALDGIRQLYRMLCLHTNRKPVLGRQNVEAQLDFIREEVSVMNEVYQYVTGRKDNVAEASRSVLTLVRRLKRKTPRKSKTNLKATTTKSKIRFETGSDSETESESEAESDQQLPAC